MFRTYVCVTHGALTQLMEALEKTKINLEADEKSLTDNRSVLASKEAETKALTEQLPKPCMQHMQHAGGIEDMQARCVDAL